MIVLGSAAHRGTPVPETPKCPRIAFFDYLDVFEDFMPHYGIDQEAFATRWVGSGNHDFLALVERDIGDVTWYSFTLRPELREARHEVTGFRVRFLFSALPHRLLWRRFYLSRWSWRWRRAYPVFATLASYLSVPSLSFFKAMREDRPDLFFLQDYASGRFDVLLGIARVLGVPLIAYHSGSSPEGYLGKWLKKLTIRRADCLIVSGRRELEMLQEEFSVPTERLRLILTPIDTEIFVPLDRREACLAAGLDPSRRHLLFIGRLQDSVKRVSSIIRAFAQSARHYSDVDLLIAGSGPDEAMLKDLGERELPGRVRFLGWVAGDVEKANLYNSAECLILASKSEGFPTVIGEALACGTPALATDVGGVGELVADGQTGWLIAPLDDQALAARLSSVLRDPQASASMRPRARAVAEKRVSRSAVGAALSECFSEVLARA